MTEPTQSRQTSSKAIPWWVGAIVLIGALITAAGGVIALVKPEILTGAPMNSAAYVYAGYLISRDLGLALALVATLILRMRRELAGLMLLTALIQVIDILVDATTGRLSILPAIIVVGAAFLIGALRLYEWKFVQAVSSASS